MELLLKCTSCSKWASTSGSLRTFRNQSVDSTNHMSRISKEVQITQLLHIWGPSTESRCDILASKWAINCKTLKNIFKSNKGLFYNSINYPFSTWDNRWVSAALYLYPSYVKYFNSLSCCWPIGETQELLQSWQTGELHLLSPHIRVQSWGLYLLPLCP